MQALPIIKQPTVNTNQPSESKNSQNFKLVSKVQSGENLPWRGEWWTKQMLDDEWMQDKAQGWQRSMKIEEIWGEEGVGFVGEEEEQGRRRSGMRACVREGEEGIFF